ncbi:hypothetical protein VTK73DRAFT_4475 [Phialemonium thermophilum]|uniref:Pinin/SDK/MemA protein domain-containing protein n=1 Tax=Phialemonium thermophilum TaxID=223376 RepID=A0ABR3WT30_9PEZI
MSADLEAETAGAGTGAQDNQQANGSADAELQHPQKRKAEQQESDAPHSREISPKRLRLDEVHDVSATDEKGSTATDKEHRDPPQLSAIHERSEPRDAATSDVTDPAGATSETTAQGRRSPEDLPTADRRASLSGPDRKRSFALEEKKRGQRLFGNLMSTISRSTVNPQQQKRLEIERRQQERAQKQRAEDDKRRSEKLAKILRVRKIEQVKFDEQVMQTRHTNMLALAHSLQTRSQPRLYYRPWEFTRAQEDIIEEQIQTAKDNIEREKQDFARQKEQRLRHLGVTVGEPASCEDTNNRDNDAPTCKTSHEKDHDETGDVMVEAEEDTVIY